MKPPHIISTWIATAVLLSSCSEKQPIAGVAPIEFAGRPTFRSCAITTPLTGNWEAGVSQGYFSDEPDEEIDFLEITLEFPEDGVNIVVPFEAAFLLRDLPVDILDRPVTELVTFDEESNMVTFDLGTATITTPIPQE